MAAVMLTALLPQPLTCSRAGKAGKDGRKGRKGPPLDNRMYKDKRAAHAHTQGLQPDASACHVSSE